MVCPLCNGRKARRRCPALDRDICPICCGTKRLVEINCPKDCPWLAGSRAHPPATVLRQRERDARFIVPLVHELPERAYGLFLMLQDVTRGYRRTAIPPLTDEDVRQAAEALAATFETAERGIIYEHQPRSLTSQRLLMALKAALHDVAEEAHTAAALERDAARALRRMERAAADAKTKLEASDTAYLDLLARLPYESPDREHRHAEPEGRDQGAPSKAAEQPRIVLP